MKGIARELESKEPCGALADLALSAKPATLSDDQKITLLIVARNMIAALSYVQLAVLREFGDITELAMAVHESEQSVVRLKEQSGALDILPLLSELLREGKLDARRLEAVRERVVNMGSREMIAQVESTLVEAAPGLTRTQLARRTTKLVAQVDPAGYEQRRQKAKGKRRVEFIPLPDDMGQLRITLSAVDAREAFDLLTQDAMALPKDGRSTDQKRADAFLDRFLGYGVDRKVKVHVTVSMETLMGLTDQPGLLDGYGPIAADGARELAKRGSWRGLLLDEYQRAAEMNTKRYRPTARTREFVIARDGGTCSAPGCVKPIQELDHTIAWPKGQTTAAGLKGYCARHHHRRHDDHAVTVDEGGTVHWVTPTGRHHTRQPHQCS